MINIDNKKYFAVILLMGALYGGIFYPFFTEFLEFGYSLSGKVIIYDFNEFYTSRDIAPSILYIIAKYFANYFDDVNIANQIVSSIFSTLAFGSVYLFSIKFFPNNKLNFFIPIGLTTIFFPNYFLYPLWFPSYFFIWGQISFYMFILSISLPSNNIILKSIFLSIVTLCHPIYGSINLIYLIFLTIRFNKFKLPKFNLQKSLIFSLVFYLTLSLTWSEGFLNYLKEDKKIIDIININNLKNNSYNANKLKTLSSNEKIKIEEDKPFLKEFKNQEGSLISDKKENLIPIGNYHSSLYHGDLKQFFQKIIFFLMLVVPTYLIYRNKQYFSNDLIRLNNFLALLLISTITISFISILFPIIGYPFKSFITLYDATAPNRIFNCYFLIFVIIILNSITLQTFKSRNFFNLSKLLFLIIFILPVPVFFLPYFFHKPYPSIVGLTLIGLIMFSIINFISLNFFKKNLIKIFFEYSENLFTKIIKFKFIAQILFFMLVGIGSIAVRFVDNNIGPQYFAFFPKNENFLNKIQQLSLKNKDVSLAVLASYNVHGVKGMNVQQLTSLQYILPTESLPKYYYNQKLKSVGCYEKIVSTNKSSHYIWDNFANYIKDCYENKSYDEWQIIMKKFKLLGVMVPQSYKLKFKNKISDGVFSLYY